MKAAVAAVILLLVAGCGSEPRGDGDPVARQVLAYADHARTLDARVAGSATALLREGADPGATRLELQELLQQSALLEEDVSSRVPFGAPGRVPALEAAREVRKAAGFVHSYSRGLAPGLPLARAHLARAAGALRGAARVLGPRLTAADAAALERLRTAPPLS